MSDAEIVRLIKRERMEMLEVYEAPHNLPVTQFARLAGKSRDQINREIKAGKLLALSMGNRGQRIPDWQLDPVKQRLVLAVLKQVVKVDSWQLYRDLLQTRELLQGYSAVEAVLETNLQEVVKVVSLDFVGDGLVSGVT